MTYTPRPGDVLAINYHDKRFMARVIQAVTGSPFTHVATYLGHGQVGEACSGGYQVSPLTNYAPSVCELQWAPFPGTDEQRAAVVTECRVMAAVNLAYGWVDVAALLLAWLGIKPGPVVRRLRSRRTAFCSQAAALAWTWAGVIFTTAPAYEVVPADFAKIGAQALMGDTVEAPRD